MSKRGRLAQSFEVRTQATAVAARAGRAKEAKLNSIFGLPPKLHKPTLPRRALGCHQQQLPSAAISAAPSLNGRQDGEQVKVRWDLKIPDNTRSSGEQSL